MTWHATGYEVVCLMCFAAAGRRYCLSVSAYMVIIDISAEFNSCGEHDGCHWLEVGI